MFTHEAAKKSVSCTHVNIWISKIMDNVTNTSVLVEILSASWQIVMHLSQ